MSVAFPWLTLLVGCVGAALLGWLRTRWASSPLPAAGGPRYTERDVLALVLLVLLALGLRLVGLEARVIDNDEPVGLGMRTLGEWISERDARLHPPLPLLAMTWFAGGEVDVVAARQVSVLAGVVSVALAFAIARRVEPRAAALVGLLVATAPAMLHSSQLARGYALLACGLLAAHLALSRALQRARSLDYWAYTLACVLAASAEYLAIAPLVADAAVSLWLVRRDPARRVGVVTAFVGALGVLAFYVPIAASSLSLGIGGGPHSPSGAADALVQSLRMLGGVAGGPGGALLLCAALLSLRFRTALTARVVAVVLVTLAVALLGAVVTSVRARYVLHAVPFLLIALGIFAVATRLRLLLGGGLVALNVAALPGYYDRSTTLAEVNTGLPLPGLLGIVADDPAAPVIVLPYYAIAEPSWRLARAFPGQDAGNCPVRLCILRKRSRPIYGADAGEDLEAVFERAPHSYVLARRHTRPALPERCVVLGDEGDATLWRCPRP
ncbi:MAG: glycosyltransferase family 39 protein [Polyangiaceae bacterium]|nr:glycosyltransferase family 39 protein [Polyangiaceae bacterium]